jgi:hypothetical protein
MNNDDLHNTDNSDYTYDVLAAPKAEPTDTVYVNLTDTPDTDNVANRLSQAKDSKLKSLTNRNDNANLDNSFTQMEDGRVESNANKIYNNMSDNEIQSLLQFVMSEKTLGRDENGNVIDKNGNAYSGSTRRFYSGLTKDDSSKAYKVGLSRGDKPDSSYRYKEELGGWESGKLGIDTNKFESDTLHNYGVATMIEAVMHGREKSMEGRIVRDMYAQPFDRDLYGTGASEYYKNKEALLGSPTEVNMELGERLFNEYMEKVPENQRQFSKRVNSTVGYMLNGSDGVDTTTETYKKVEALNKQYKEDRGFKAVDVYDNINNSVRGFASTFVSELVVNPADAVGDLTGLYDLGTDDELTKSVNKTFGYDASVVAESMEKVGQHWDKLANDELPVADRVRAAANGMLEVFTTPEMLGTSLGALMAWVSPGALFKAVGVGSKYASTLQRIDKLVDAGKLTKLSGRAKKAKAFMSVDGAKNFLVSQSGYITAAMGNINQQYEEFVGNNNGTELEGSEKAKWFAGRFAVQLFNQNLDKLVDFNVMKGAGSVKALVPAVKAMTQKEFGNVVYTMAKGVAVTAKNAGSEAAQEYSQTMMELYNSRYGSEQFKDVDTFNKFLSDPRNSREGGIAALAGAGGSGQFEVAGAILPSVAFGSQAVADSTAGILSKNTPEQTPATPVVDSSEEEVKQAKSNYAQLLTRVNNYTAEKGVNESNIGILLDDLDELNNNKYIIDGAPKDKVAAGEESYTAVVNQLEKFIIDNPSLKLSKRLVRKTVKESVADNDVQKVVNSIPVDTKTAFGGLSKVTGIGEDLDDKTAIGNVLKLFKDGTYESVVKEVGTIDDELQTLEKTLTGNISESIEETFDVLQDQLRGKTLKSFAQVTKDSSDTVLGSGPTTNENTDPDLEELDYDDETRSLTAERILRTVLGSRDTFSNEFKDKAEVFGVTNGIEKSSIKAIIKSYSSVQDEATSGNRGYQSRLSKLKGLVSSSNPNKKAIAKEDTELRNMYAAILNSQTALERGVKGAEQKAIELNKSTVSGKSTVQYKTSYKKFNGESYVINIKKTEGVWIADVVGANNLAKTKKGYTDDIVKGLNKLKLKTTGDASTDSGNLVVPVREYKSKSQRQSDIGYINKITAVTNDVAPGSNGITKVILGQKTHDKWDIKGDYHKANMLIINNESFTSDDVVLLDSIDLKTSEDGKRYRPALGEAGLKSLKAAMAAGATIVLDSAMVNSTDARNNPRQASALAGYIGSKNSGYSVLAGPDKYIFVKDTPENKKAIRQRKAQFQTEKAENDLVVSSKEKAVSLFRSLEKGLSVVTGKPLTDKDRVSVEAEYDSVRKVLLEKSFENDTKLTSFIERESNAAVVKQGKDILNNPDSTPPVYEDKVLQQLVEEYVVSESDRDQVGENLLSEWDTTVKAGLNKKDKESKVDKLLSALGLTAKNLVINILGDKSFTKGKDDLYESVYTSVSTGEVMAIPLRKNMSVEDYDSLIAKNDENKGHVKYGTKHIFVGVRRVVQDMTKLVNVSKTTVSNSVSMDYLPFSIRDAVANFSDNSKKALMKIEPAELAEQTYSRGPDGKVLDGAFNLHNSPARGLFFNNEGKVNEEVLVATYLALGDVMVGDRSAMSRGWKSDYDVAQMFGVQEFEVTTDMQQFAYSHGSLLKTAANALGKNIMSQLGITKKVSKETSANEYEALLSDIGNTALLIAEEQGLLQSSSEKSNEMAKLYKDGEQRKLNTDTHFIHISDVLDKSNKYTRNVPNKKVLSFVSTYEEAAENMPEASTTRVEPYFSAPDQDRLDTAKNVVRNDISGKQVPENAKETLEILMDTPYSADLERINEILDAVEAEGSQVKKLLGYVDLKSKEFENLYFKDKEVQEAKNDAIDKSLKELTMLRDNVVKMDSADVELYFDYFYSSNDRYMLDSNTVNPQVDKLHRFLIVPKGHKLDYGVTTNKDGGIEFSVGEGTDQDQSFTVRMALTQAFGQSVDKMDANDIIAFGNTMLSLSAEQLATVKKEMLKEGEMDVEADGVSYTLEAEHLSHTLQAIDFLTNVHAANGNGKITSSLSLEFDSLTSGFANKIQQMPILSDMDEHFARTGVLTKEYQDRLQKALNFKGENVPFAPQDGQSIADVLAIKYDGNDGDLEFLDSYKTMAKVTIGKLQDGDKQRENLTQSLKPNMNSGSSVFETIKPLLPGGEFIDAGDAHISITSTLRNLFKDPFMIFNYSASIGRIIQNLGNNVAHDIAKNIATADFGNPKHAGVKLVAADLVESVKIVDPDNSDKILKTAEDLQNALKNHSLKKLKLKFSMSVEAAKEGQKPKKVNNLEEMFESVVKATYGEVIKDVFTESFGPFIQMQDSMNDTFKIAFRVFDKKRVDMLKAIQKTKPDRFISADDHAKVLEDLWDDFPWIVGPLSGANSKKDVISVVTTSVRSPNAIEESRKKPQAVLNASKDSKTRTVTPLVKYLEEAVSAGSVLPFHAIDGAEISKAFIAMDIKSMAAIHDAIIPPLNRSDDVGFEYQKGMAETNTDYSLVDALESLVERMSTTLGKSDFDKEFKNVTVKGLKTLDKTDNLDFPAAALEIAGNMRARISNIKEERNKWYGKGGKLEGAYYGNLVGTPGGMYRTGYTDDNGKYQEATAAPDLSYKEKFKLDGVYKKLDVQDKPDTVVSTANNAAKVDMKTDINFATSLKDNNAITATNITFNIEGC